ncbi:MAG: hypothetical protein PHX53_01315 [Syntrophales bacterium]|nr:hypothetical protein [Syntrophales bacterium]
MKRLGKFEDLILMSDPQAVLAEVHYIFSLLHADFDDTLLNQVFADVVQLFKGEYPGYQKCNTWYHDLKHTTDCLLAMVRLLHGASLSGLAIPEREVALGLIAALLHDTGYIQTADDLEGTGAKYTLTHVPRSVAFIEQYFPQAGFSSRDLDYCRCCINCTGLEVSIGDLTFESEHHQIVAWMLGTADLLGQMADRTYLERLPFLYQEFEEGKVPGFESELDLLKKTPAFWEFTKQRLAKELGNVARYMRDHFRVRWGLDRDLNQETIEGNIAYLQYILDNHESEYRRYLRRGGYMAILNSRDKTALAGEKK